MKLNPADFFVSIRTSTRCLLLSIPFSLFSAISSAREDMRRLSCCTIDTSKEEETRWAVCMFLVSVCHIIESSSTISSSDLRRTSWRTTDCPMAGPRRSNSFKTLSTNCNNILIYRWVRSGYSVTSLCPLLSRCYSIENTVLCMIIRLFFHTCCSLLCCLSQNQYQRLWNSNSDQCDPFPSSFSHYTLFIPSIQKRRKERKRQSKEHSKEHSSSIFIQPKKIIANQFCDAQWSAPYSDFSWLS